MEDDCYNGKEEHNSVTQFSRTGTLDITIKPISRLEILYGLLSPERMTRKMAERAKINGIDNFEYQVVGIFLLYFVYMLIFHSV